MVFPIITIYNGDHFRKHDNVKQYYQFNLPGKTVWFETLCASLLVTEIGPKIKVMIVTPQKISKRRTLTISGSQSVTLVICRDEAAPQPPSSRFVDTSARIQGKRQTS